jgi:hypothetical protein
MATVSDVDACARGHSVDFSPFVQGMQNPKALWTYVPHRQVRNVVSGGPIQRLAGRRVPDGEVFYILKVAGCRHRPMAQPLQHDPSALIIGPPAARP